MVNSADHDFVTPDSTRVIVGYRSAQRNTGSMLIVVAGLVLFAVTDAAWAQSVTANGTTSPIAVYSGSTVSIHAIRNAAPNRYDFVGLYLVGTSNSSHLQSWYMNGTTTAPAAPGIADATFNVTILMAPGNYEFRYFANGNTTQLLATSGMMTVNAPLITVNTISPPNTVPAAPSEVVSLSITGGTGGSRYDWIGMFRVGAAGTTTGAALAWNYLSGTHTAPPAALTTATFQMTLPIARGAYEFRYFKSGNTYLSTSPQVIATSPMTPRERFGVVTFDLSSSPYLDDRIQELGVGTLRGSCDWYAMQPTQGGQIDWGCTDDVIYIAATMGLRVLMTITCTPVWANGSSTTTDRVCEVKMPDDISSWTNFVSEFVQKYSSYDVILGVYNEPNLGHGAATAMSYTNYCTLFEAAVSARASSRMRLAGPETSWHGSRASDHYFADAANCMLPNMRSDDIFTLHYYPDADFSPSWEAYSAAQVAEGHEVWLSEVGLNTSVNTQQQYFVNTFFEEFDDAAQYNPLWTTSIYYRLYNPLPSDSHYYYSLLLSNTSKRPAFFNYKAIISELSGAGPGTLGSGESLGPGESIFSADNAVQLIYQMDGDLALIGLDLLWHTATTDANEVAMQSDGNLVVYNTVPTAVWATGTGDNPKAYLVVQADGELKLYNASGQPILTLFTPQ